MTAIIYSGTPTASQNRVPSNIETLEELLAWGLSLFHNLHGARDIYLVEGQVPVKQAIQNRFKGADGKDYIAHTVYLPIDPANESDNSKKTWKWIYEITNAVGPSTYNS